MSGEVQNMGNPGSNVQRPQLTFPSDEQVKSSLPIKGKRESPKIIGHPTNNVFIPIL